MAGFKFDASRTSGDDRKLESTWSSLGRSWEDIDKAIPFSQAARLLAAATKPGTVSQLMFQLDRKDPNVMTE